MDPFFDKRVDIIRRVSAHERLVNIGLRPSANFKKQKAGCKSGDTCLFPHFEVDEQPDKKAEERLLPKKKRKRGQRRCGHCEKRIAIGCCVLQDSDALDSHRNERVSGRPDAKKSCTQSQRVRFTKSTLREYPGQERPIAWKNASQTSTSAKSLRHKMRCAQSKAWNRAKQTNVFNPCSENSKNMIREVGNVECLKLCETDSQGQCSCCLT